jgi:hypothetical protein
LQEPCEQQVAPAHPIPPHCPYSAEQLPPPPFPPVDGGGGDGFDGGGGLGLELLVAGGGGLGEVESVDPTVMLADPWLPKPSVLTIW